MKKIELLAERAKIVALMQLTEYYSCEMQGRFGEFRRTSITEGELKANFENDQKSLRRLDAINNALFESDAKEYIDVMGNHLSVATARKYLDEFQMDVLVDSRRDEFDDIEKEKQICPGENARAKMYDKCIVYEFETVDKDPMGLKSRVTEFNKKLLDWYYGLKAAVSISDATTEIDCPY